MRNYLAQLGSARVTQLTALADQRNHALSVRVWPLELNDVSGFLSQQGYRLQHVANDRDGDKGQDLIFETVWVRCDAS